MTGTRTGGMAWLRAAAVMGLAVGLASCGSTGAGNQMSNITLEAAKGKLLDLQHQIIERVPKDLVITVVENDRSTLMQCPGDQKKWTGTGQVELRPGLDRTKFLNDVRDMVAGQPDWKIGGGTDKDGAPTVDLLHNDGTHLIVGIWDGPESLQIDGFSACFDFPEYQYGEEY
ncbi:hypothetical protein ACX80S_01465 [Arthrobacter sp. RHLT1-20]